MNDTTTTTFKPVTKADAVDLGAGRRHIVYHRVLRNSDGTALRARPSGKCQTWVTRPTQFKLPCKHGMYESFYITERDACDWSLEEPQYTKAHTPSKT